MKERIAALTCAHVAESPAAPGHGPSPAQPEEDAAALSLAEADGIPGVQNMVDHFTVCSEI